MVERKRTPLGALLVEAGLITSRQLEEALAEHKLTGRRLGSVLLERELITSERLTQVLSFQLSLPWVTLHQANPAADLLALVPKDLAARHRLVPVYLRREKVGSATLYVATDDPTNEAGLAECAKLNRIPVVPMVAAPADVSQALLRHYGVAPSLTPPTPEVTPASSVPPAPHQALTVPARRPAADVPDVVLGALRAHVTEMPPAPRAEPPAAQELAAVSRSGEYPARPGLPVLLVGARAEFVRRCRDAACDGVSISTASLKDVRERALGKKPIALVVMEELYAFDRVAFSRLAREVGAQLVVWNEDLDVEFLAAVLEAARGAAGA